MDIQSTPFPGKIRKKTGKMEADQKPVDPEKKANVKEAPFPFRKERPKNVFERLASSAIVSSPAKINTTAEIPPAPKKITAKISKPKAIRVRGDRNSVTHNNQEKTEAEAEAEANAKEAGTTNDKGAVPMPAADKENSSKKKKKKKVSFPKELKEKEEEDGLRTPMQKLQLSQKPSSSSRKFLAGATPYLSAENCSKCKIHRLEASSYWLTQIKLAESADKHFVAASFFCLAHQCKAQPVRSLLMELKRYLGRHTWLYEETEWKSTSLCYGLLSNITEDGSSVGVAGSLDFKAEDDTTIKSLEPQPNDE